MNLQNGSVQPDVDFSFSNNVMEPDVRHDRNYALYLFLLLIVLFAVAVAVIYFSNGDLPTVN